MGGQQFATDGICIDSRSLNRVISFDRERVRRKRKKRRGAYEFTARYHRGSLTKPLRFQPDKLPRLLP